MMATSLTTSNNGQHTVLPVVPNTAPNQAPNAPAAVTAAIPLKAAVFMTPQA